MWVASSSGDQRLGTNLLKNYKNHSASSHGPRASYGERTLAHCLGVWTAKIHMFKDSAKCSYTPGALTIHKIDLSGSKIVIAFS